MCFTFEGVCFVFEFLVLILHKIAQHLNIDWKSEKKMFRICIEMIYEILSIKNFPYFKFCHKESYTNIKGPAVPFGPNDKNYFATEETCFIKI